jgi:glycosyltransferase involved in cell wall biosynthesis
VSQWGAKADHLQVVPLFVDPLLFRPDADPQRDAQHRTEIGLSRAPYLLAVGNVEPRKNLSAVLAAFTQIASLPEYQDYQLVLAGAQSPMTENLLAPVPSALLSRIHFTGRVAEHHLGALYRGASVFLFPSLYEGFGLPVLEAMQCGVPVITSNVASLPEVAGEAALLVPPDKPEILALAIRQILSTPELAEQMRHKGLERAQQFTTQAFVHEVVQAAQKARARA